MRNNYIKKTHLRIALSGNFLELYEFENPIYYDFPAERKRSIVPNENGKEKEDSRKRSRGRSRKMVKRLVYSNFNQWLDESQNPYYSKFLTLTFREKILEVWEGNKEFTLFIKRLNYFIFQSKKSVIQYLAVIEFQPTSKRVHYHVVLFNLPYIPRYIDVFNKAWNRGFLVIKVIKNERHAANYITKYMTKEDDDRLRGEKSYFCSRDLKRPVFMKNEDTILQLIDKINPHIPIFQKTFENEHTGKTNYSCYDIAKDENLRELIKEMA